LSKPIKEIDRIGPNYAEKLAKVRITQFMTKRM